MTPEYYNELASVFVAVMLVMCFVIGFISGKL